MLRVAMLATTAGVVAVLVLRRRRKLLAKTSAPSRVQQAQAYIDTVADEDAVGKLSELYGRVRNPDGTLDNVLTIHSLNPPALEAHYEFYVRALRGESPLTRVERELVAVAVSVDNSCRY